MDTNCKYSSFRLCCLITTPKLTEKAITLFQNEHIPTQYQIHAQGTASNEIMDLLGLGSIDKNILISFLPKEISDDLMKKLNRLLKLKTKNSGIAFSIPITGANKFILHLFKHF